MCVIVLIDIDFPTHLHKIIFRTLHFVFDYNYTAFTSSHPLSPSMSAAEQACQRDTSVTVNRIILILSVSSVDTNGVVV